MIYPVIGLRMWMHSISIWRSSSYTLLRYYSRDMTLVPNFLTWLSWFEDLIRDSRRAIYVQKPLCWSYEWMFHQTNQSLSIPQVNSLRESEIWGKSFKIMSLTGTDSMTECLLFSANPHRRDRSNIKPNRSFFPPETNALAVIMTHVLLCGYSWLTWLGRWCVTAWIPAFVLLNMLFTNCLRCVEA